MGCCEVAMMERSQAEGVRGSGQGACIPSTSILLDTRRTVHPSTHIPNVLLHPTPQFLNKRIAHPCHLQTPARCSRVACCAAHDSAANGRRGRCWSRSPARHHPHPPALLHSSP